MAGGHQLPHECVGRLLLGVRPLSVRRAIIEHLFGVKCNLTDIAEDCGAHVNTVSKQNAVVRKWLEGDTKTDSVGVIDAA
nr:hypothetical protein [Burkholderia multivorans]